MALVVRPFTYVNGNIIDADENNPNEDTLYNLVNGALDDANIAVGADIQFAKLEDCPQDFILVGDVTNKAAPSATLPAPVIAAISHSDLADLNVPGDHTWATLVDGTRDFTGDQSMGNNQLTNVGAPAAGGDAANKTYVDGEVSSLRADAVLRDGSQAFTGNQSMGVNRITNVVNPVGAQDAATKDYVDTTIAADYVTIATNQTVAGADPITGDKDFTGDVGLDGAATFTNTFYSSTGLIMFDAGDDKTDENLTERTSFNSVETTDDGNFVVLSEAVGATDGSKIQVSYFLSASSIPSQSAGLYEVASLVETGMFTARRSGGAIGSTLTVISSATVADGTLSTNLNVSGNDIRLRMQVANGDNADYRARVHYTIHEWIE
jgi:hypothetical protein